MIRFLSLLFVALTLGLAFAHVLEVVGKLRLAGPEWLVVQHNLYVAFGPVGGSIEVLGIVFTWIAVARRRRGTAAWNWTLLAALAVTLGLIDWALVVAPMNGVLDAWTPRSLPPDWTDVRDRWEIGHAVQAALFLVGFGALVAAALGETRSSGRAAPD